ncbi:MAG: NUDIX hydrolase [Candidatus Abawacabacteria bacterium]|nr:NUDIX hydrolase [Candidatus Abawacabacteria bacterium]
MNCRVIVSAVIEKDNKILMGSKPKDIGPYPNTLHIPGGGVELGAESLMTAVKREVFEETGLEIDNVQRINFNEDFTPNHNGIMTHYIFLVYHAQYKSGELKTPDSEFRTLGWYPKESLKSLALAAPSIELFKSMGWL